MKPIEPKEGKPPYAFSAFANKTITPVNKGKDGNTIQMLFPSREIDGADIMLVDARKQILQFVRSLERFTYEESCKHVLYIKIRQIPVYSNSHTANASGEQYS